MIQALTEAGLEVVRVTRSSISIADPNGGKNIRLKGAFYEQSLQTGAEFEKKLKERAESTEKMLNDEFRKLGESVSEAVTSNETKIRDAIALFTALDREIAGKTQGRGERGDDAAQEGRVKAGREYGHDVTGDSLSPVYRMSGGTLWYLGGRIQANPEEIRKQEETLQKLNAKTWGVEFVQDGEKEISGHSARDVSRGDAPSGKDWIQLTE